MAKTKRSEGEEQEPVEEVEEEAEAQEGEEEEEEKDEEVEAEEPRKPGPPVLKSGGKPGGKAVAKAKSKAKAKAAPANPKAKAAPANPKAKADPAKPKAKADPAKPKAKADPAKPKGPKAKAKSTPKAKADPKKKPATPKAKAEPKGKAEGKGKPLVRKRSMAEALTGEWINGLEPEESETAEPEETPEPASARRDRAKSHKFSVLLASGAVPETLKTEWEALNASGKRKQMTKFIEDTVTRDPETGRLVLSCDAAEVRGQSSLACEEAGHRMGRQRTAPHVVQRALWAQRGVIAASDLE